MSDLKAHQPDFFLPVYTPGRSLRDDQDFMSLPFFASEKGPAIFYMEAKIATKHVTQFVRVKGNQDGIATMWDKRLLVYIQTLILQTMNDGQPVSRKVTFAPYDFFKAIGSATGKNEYDRFKASLKRLKGTTVESDTQAQNMSALTGVGFIDSYQFRERNTANGKRNAGVTIVLSEWLFLKFTEEGKALAVHPDYFKLTSGIEMRIYELCRKFVGHQAHPIRMNLELFHLRVNGGRGRSLDMKYAINRVHKKGGILGYDIEVEPHKPRTPASRVMVRMSKITGPSRLLSFD
ncbi:plasmid replication initiator TrfA [Woodsholea maritima]|uniref:plasmid replication initiator TrfA n=1 Tax=Woodsholea maritima TaxID=240237 RepID=UPI0003787BF8|nr:plasmid replication initiator TrfA [Woodsholea maritima]